jgi:glucose-1-phosphate thymidylyltransferase
MKVIILAAGYATRLYPLTLTQPKPLLDVAGKPMIEHVLDNIAPIPGIDRIYVVTNAKVRRAFPKMGRPLSRDEIEAGFHGRKRRLDG